MSMQFNLPPITGVPDTSYYDGQLVNYDFAVNGNKATLGVIQPGFKGTFPVSEGGEDITVVEDILDAGLYIEVLDADGALEDSRILTKAGDEISASEGKTLKVATSSAVVKYVCVYPGQPVSTE